MPISVFSADNEKGGVWQRWLCAPRHLTYVFAGVQGYHLVANVAAAEISADWMVPSVSSDTLLATETVNGLTNDGVAANQEKVSLTFANTVTATWRIEEEFTYQILTNGDWIDVTANMTVIEFVEFVEFG